MGGKERDGHENRGLLRCVYGAVLVPGCILTWVYVFPGWAHQSCLSHRTFQQPGCLAWSDSLTRLLCSSQSLSQQDSCSTHMRPGFSPQLWSPASLQTFPWTKEGAVAGKGAPIRQYPRGPACEKTQESLASNCATSRQEEEVYLWAYQLCKSGQASPRCRGLGGGGPQRSSSWPQGAAHRGLRAWTQTPIKKAVRTDPQKRIYTLVKESTFVLQMSIHMMKISFNRQIKYYPSYAIFSR